MKFHSHYPSAIRNNTLHIWKIPLDNCTDISGCYEILNNEEKNKAESLETFNKHIKYIICRSSIKKILGYYLNIDPRNIIFEYNNYGKPALCNTCVNINFNVSHSSDLALCAITPIDINIGIDLECINYLENPDELAKVFLTHEEYLQFLNIVPEDKPRIFYKLWTCKESALKAIGMGLHFPIKNVELCLSSDGSIINNNIIIDSKIWHLYQCKTVYNDKHYQASGTTSEHIKQVSCYTFTKV